MIMFCMFYVAGTQLLCFANDDDDDSDDYIERACDAMTFTMFIECVILYRVNG